MDWGQEGGSCDKNYRSFNRVQLPFGAGTAWSFFSDENKLYVGVLKPQAKPACSDKGSIGFVVAHTAGETEVRPNTSVNGIFKDKRHHLGFNLKSGLLYIDKKTQTLKVFRDNQPIQFEGNTIPLNDIVEDNNPTYWINAPLHGFVGLMPTGVHFQFLLTIRIIPMA